MLSIEPGDRVVVETHDAFEGKITSESDIPSELLEVPFLNPNDTQCGPIFMAGAEKGDVLAVHIESMAPRGPQPRGTCCMIKEFGGLTGTYYTATLNEPLPGRCARWKWTKRTSTGATGSRSPTSRTSAPSAAHPRSDSINSLTPDDHGGNMDLPDMGPGTITYLPVRAPGALLYIGDAHACQGDGEVCGVAVEYPTTTTITVDLIKGWTIDWPRLEADDFIMTIGSARPLEDATRIAYRELVRWMVKDYGYDQWDAYMMLSQCGKVRLGNFVDPSTRWARRFRRSTCSGRRGFAPRVSPPAARPPMRDRLTWNNRRTVGNCVYSKNQMGRYLKHLASVSSSVAREHLCA